MISVQELILRVPTVCILSDNKWRRRWNKVMAVVVLYQFMITTIRISYLLEYNMGIYVANWVADLLLLADIVFLLFCSVEIAGREVTDPKKARALYLRKNFIFDVFSQFPLDRIVEFATRSTRPIWSLNRITRIYKLNQYHEELEEQSSVPLVWTIARQMFLALMCFHIFGCGFSLMFDLTNASASFMGPFNKQVWKTLQFPSRYLRCFFLAMVTTASFGNTTPATLGESYFLITASMAGMTMLVAVIGSVGSLMVNMDSDATAFRQKMETLNQYMKYRNIPHHSILKVQAYNQYLWETRRGLNETSTINELPRYLRMEVTWFLNHEVIEKVPLFQGASAMFIMVICANLQSRVELKSEIIFRKGDVGREMYFISKGSVNVVTDDDTVVATLGEGRYFGEVALIYDCKRTATIRAGTNCDLFVLSVDVFQELIEHFPEDSKAMLEAAKERYKPPS